MTLQEAIDMQEALKPSAIPESMKITWLSTLDGSIKAEVIDTHKGGEQIAFSGYDESNKEQQLLAPAPYDRLYVSFLIAQIERYSGEIEKYNNSIMLYNVDYNDYTNWYNRTHEGIIPQLKL